MKNIDVIDAFITHRHLSYGNLRSDGVRLFSYSTCIAQWDTPYILLNISKYSTTTSRHTSLLLRELNKSMYSMYINEIDNVPIGTQFLKYERD